MENISEELIRRPWGVINEENAFFVVRGLLRETKIEEWDDKFFFAANTIADEKFRRHGNKLTRK